MSPTRVSRPRVTVFAGLTAGLLVGVATAVLAGTAVADRVAPGAPAFLEATHLPPLLTAPNERVELRYDVYCAAAGEPAGDEPCPASGTVFLRAGTSGPFTEISLREDPAAAEGRFVAAVPAAIARGPAGFSYYAVIRSPATPETVTLPSGGAAAAHRSIPLAAGRVPTSLPAHVFGKSRSADARVVEAPWGTGRGEVGLESIGPSLPPIGGSSFDVTRHGDVHVLDEANRRVLRFAAGARSAAHVPLAIDGTLADMSVADDGTIYVLETAHAGGDKGLLRAFAPDGAAKGANELAERASQVRMGPSGPVVLQTTSGQWRSAAENGRMLGLSAQKASGRSGRPLPGGREVVVLREGNELRASVIGPGSLFQSWRVVSETPLADVQLAEPWGSRLVVVVRTYTDQSDEFLVLVLGRTGIEQQFSLDSSDWAETAPLSRFRLVGSSLFQLGSTPAGLFVDRIDLEVKR